MPRRGHEGAVTASYRLSSGNRRQRSSGGVHTLAPRRTSIKVQPKEDDHIRILRDRARRAPFYSLIVLNGVHVHSLTSVEG